MLKKDKSAWTVEYTTFLENFEGPLDLLLSLIKQEKIEIKDIFVSKVTDQFLAYMHAFAEIDIYKSSEYLAIATTILEIKSKSLLPNCIEPEQEEQEKEETLIAALEEYKFIKEKTIQLKELEQVGYFFKEADNSVGKSKILYKDFQLEKLLEAFTSFMLRQESKMARKDKKKEIPKEIFTIQDKIKTIYQIVDTEKEVQFEKLFLPTSSTTEIITTFQALLELLKEQVLHAQQDKIFGNISITINQNHFEEFHFEKFEKIE